MEGWGEQRMCKGRGNRTGNDSRARALMKRRAGVQWRAGQAIMAEISSVLWLWGPVGQDAERAQGRRAGADRPPCSTLPPTKAVVFVAESLAEASEWWACSTRLAAFHPFILFSHTPNLLPASFFPLSFLLSFLLSSPLYLLNSFPYSLGKLSISNITFFPCFTNALVLSLTPNYYWSTS